MQNVKKQTPRNLIFRCRMTHLNYSLKKLGKTFKLQKELLKAEMNHDEIDEINWRQRGEEWLPCIKNDVLCTAFSYAWYCKAMFEITGFSLKDCLSLPGLGWKYFNSLRTEEDKPIYTYNDKYVRWFVRQSIKGGRICAFNQYFKSKICDDILFIVSEELNVRGNIYDIIEAYLNYKNKHFRLIEKEYESKFDDYRNEDAEEKEKYINEKLSKLPIHQLTKQMKLDELLWDIDAVKSCPSTMWDEKSIYPGIETGYAFTIEMNNELSENIIASIFSQGSATLKIEYYNPESLIVHYLPVKEKVKTIEVNRTRNGYIVDTLTSVDFQEIVK